MAATVFKQKEKIYDTRIPYETVQVAKSVRSFQLYCLIIVSLPCFLTDI